MDAPEDAPPDWDVDVDARGLLCPLPVLRAARHLREMAPGGVLRLLADDPAAVIDVPHYCTESGHVLLAQSPTDDAVAYYLRRS